MLTRFRPISRSARHKESGFTIVELLIATSVFSLVLLAALTSFIGVGHLFYKGVSLTNTQNVATQVLNDITNSMQSSSAISLPSTKPGTSYTYMCIGNARYTYTTANGISVPANDSSGANYNDGNNGGNFGLLKDTLPGLSGCSPPCASGGPGSGCFNQTSPTEMLGANMRTADLKLNQVATNLYNLSIVVAYGDNSVMDLSNPKQPACVGNYSDQSFCSVANLSTTIFAGVRS